MFKMATELSVSLLATRICGLRKIKKVAGATSALVIIVTLLDQKQRHDIGRARHGNMSALSKIVKPLVENAADFLNSFSRKVYHGQQDTTSSVGVMKDSTGKEILVEDATGEYGGINAFESAADKFPSRFPSDLGTWVSESKNVADAFAGEAGAVYPLKIKLNNPKIYDEYENMEADLLQSDDTGDFVDLLKSEGHDGIEITNSFTDIPELRTDYVVFDARNIRSVNAQFDPSKADSRNILSSAPAATLTGYGALEAINGQSSN